MNDNGGPVTFGEAIDRLEAVVAQLEGDETLALEAALALFEEGLSLAEQCRRRLGAAQLRLTEIRPAADAVGVDEVPR